MAGSATDIKGIGYICNNLPGLTSALIEIATSVSRDIVTKLQRKRQLYADETGISPARFILAVGAIHSQRAAALRAAGFEVIEPEDDDG